MAIPDNHYVACFPLQEYFVDKDTGLPLSNGEVFFYVDSERSTKKNVYQQVQLPDNTYQFVVLNNPLILTSVGTFGDDSGNDIIPFLYPYNAAGQIELYYIEVYSSAGVLQFTREAWPPNVENQNEAASTFEGSDNQISNCQFVEVSYTPDPVTNAHIYSVSRSNQVTEIAPDWAIITNGIGTVTISQDALNDVSVPSQAPYAININSTSITTLQLRQRITDSPRLMGNGYVSSSFDAKSFTGSEITLIMDYVASNGYTVNLVSSNTTSTGSYTTLQNSAPTLVQSNNADAPPVGYIDIIITIPVNVHVGITSVQVVTVATAQSNTEFLQVSVPRQIDHLFHYYKPELEYKPIPSWLVGWDFPLNPAQFGATQAATAIGANKSKYVWDQTIVFQSADSGVAVAAGSAGELQLTASVDTQMAIIQYLPQATARKVLNSPLCVNVSAKTSLATKATVSLWYTTDVNLPDLNSPNYNSLVLTLDANGKPASFNGTWTEVPRLEGNAYFEIGVNSTTNFNDYSFSTWDMQGIAACNTATYFAIVVGTATVTATNTVNFNSVSLQSGSIPTRPAPQTLDEVLRECEYYYEVSTAVGTPITSASSTDSIIKNQLAAASAISGVSLYTRSFDLEYKIPKIKAPTITFYSQSASSGVVNGFIYQGGSGQINTGTLNVSALWTEQNKGTKASQYIAKTSAEYLNHAGAANNYLDGFISFHYELDARLGVV